MSQSRDAPAGRSFLSVVSITDDQSLVAQLESALTEDTELIVVSTVPVVVDRARAVQVAALESAYRRNRGLEEAHGDVVAFLEDGQVPAPEWHGAVVRAFAAFPRPSAAVATDVPVRVGGNVAYDRARLLNVHGFPLFTGAPPGSAVPDLLALAALESNGGRVARRAGMQLDRQAAAPGRDAALVGKALRARRKPLWALRRMGADVRRGALRDVVDLVDGALRERRPRDLAATADVGAVPEAVTSALGGRELIPLSAPHKGKLHFLYRAAEFVVHVYVAPTDHLRAAVAARIEIERRVRSGGMPHVHAHEEATDCLWLVEDAMPGTPLDSSTLRAAADRIADWVVELGGPPGIPLAGSTNWQAHRANLLRAPFPLAAHERLAASLDAVQTVPARHLHGDLRPRNVLADEERLAAVDWENAAVEFLPGLDLVFLFLLADGTPDERVVLAPRRLEPQLNALGLDGEQLPHALRVMLATWALGERNRRRRLGVDPGPAVFEPLYLRSEEQLT